MLQSIPELLTATDRFEDTQGAGPARNSKKRKSHKEKLRRIQTNQLFDLLRRLLHIPPKQDKQAVVKAAISLVSDLCAARVLVPPPPPGAPPTVDLPLKSSQSKGAAAAGSATGPKSKGAAAAGATGGPLPPRASTSPPAEPTQRPAWPR